MRMKTHSEEFGTRGLSSVTECLQADHARLDRFLADARQGVACGAMPEAREHFDRFDRGLRRHIRLEEHIVFPVFEERTRNAGPVAVMNGEHQRIEVLLGAAAAALAAVDRERFDAAARELTGIIEVHNRKEERILYPKTDQALDAAERRALAARFERS